MHLKSPVLSRAVQLILADPVETLRVTAPGLGLLFLCQFAIGHSVLVPVSEGLKIYGTNLRVIMAITLLAIVMVIVSWHRYALLDGPHRDALLRPTLSGYGYYMLRAVYLSITVAFLLLACLTAILILSRFAGAEKGGGLWPLDTGPGLFLFGALGYWIMLRLGLVLPAAAMERGLPMSTSLAATAPVSWELFRVAIVLTTLSVAQFFLWFVPTSPLVPVYATLATAIIYLQILISASVLSTLYGVLVQGRTL